MELRLKEDFIVLLMATRWIFFRVEILDFFVFWDLIMVCIVCVGLDDLV